MVNKDKEITESEFVFLREFYPQGKDLTLKELQKRTGYSYERVHSYLKSLANKGAVTMKTVGRTLVYSLDFKKESSRIAFYLYSKERLKNFREKHFTIASAVSELPEDQTDVLAIFGSYAKGNERKESDIDIICATAEIGELKNDIRSLKRSHNLDFAPVVISKKEFAKIKKENPEFWFDLVNYGIIFKGYELFYYYAYLI